MAGTVILTISCAAVLFLIRFFIALWKDGKPRVKCRVQRISSEDLLPGPKRAMDLLTLLQMRCEFDSGSMNDKNPREWHFEPYRYPTQQERKPGRAI